MIQLRDYQTRAVDMLREAIRTGARAPCLVAPTGMGKTRTAAAIIESTVLNGKRALFIAPRRNLVEQTHREFKKLGIDSAMIMAGVHFDPCQRVEIASIDTIMARLDNPHSNGVTALQAADVVLIDECFTPDVEILTETGFISFEKYNGNRVAQYDNGAISFVSPIAVINKHYDGDMVSLSSDKLIDLDMTAEHELLFKYASGDRKETAISAKFNHLKRMYVAGLAVGEDRELTPDERLAIAFQADGSIHASYSGRLTGLFTASFSFSKERKINEFKRLMEAGGYEWRHLDTRASIGNVKERPRFMVYGVSVTKDVSSVFDISSMSAEFAKKIIEEMVKWDGSINKKTGQYYFSSKDEKTTDFYQAVSILAGYKTNKTLQIDDRNEAYSDMHRLFITKEKREIGVQGIAKRVYHYTGNVHCVRVPSGNIIVRRNGKPIVIGNCHTAASEQRGKLINDLRSGVYGPRKIVILLTATPCTTGGGGLGNISDRLVIPVTMPELIEGGHLLQPRYYSAERPDLTGVKMVGDDYNSKQLGAVYDGKIMGCVVDNWLKIAPGTSTVVFTATRANASDVVDKFNSMGVPAAYVDANTPDEERKLIFDGIESGRILVIANVMIIGMGTDIPRLQTVSFATATKSISRWMQGVGRVLRPYDGQEFSFVIDHGGMVLDPRMGPVEFINDWSLDEKTTVQERVEKRKQEKKDPVDVACPACSYTYRAAHVCPKCGHQRKKKGEALEYHDVELKQVDAGKLSAADKRNRTTPAEEKRKFYGEVLEYVMNKGGNPGRAAHIYRSYYGCWPNAHKDAPRIPPSEETLSYIKSQAIRHAKSRKTA